MECNIDERGVRARRVWGVMNLLIAALLGAMALWSGTWWLWIIVGLCAAMGVFGLWEAKTGTLFSGDAVYDGPLLDALPHSDRAAYARTMERLLSLPVNVVHAGHDPSFGRERLRELVRAWLDQTTA